MAHENVPETERDETRDFGNEQDMPVDAKFHPTLGPTEGSQAVDQLQRIVVPVPAFNDPHNPVAASGSVNLSLNDHPVMHSSDYGANVMDEFGHDHVENPMSAGARDLQQFDLSGQSGDATAEQKAAAAGANLPENRDEWTKADWRTQAQVYGLGVSGNLDTVKDRVENHEGQQAQREEFAKQTHALTRDELDSAAQGYDIDPSTYSTKDALAQAIIAAEYDEDVPPGDKNGEEE